MAPRKPPALPTPERLEKAALHYIERYAASAEGVRRVLMRKVDRAARAGLADREKGAADVAALVEKLVARKLIDDDAFAEGRAASLARRGLPRGQIARRLQAKGAGAGAIGHALASLDEAGITDSTSAILFAKRKKLGPFCADPAKRATLRLKHLGAMARAGFDGELARRIVDAPDPASLADED
jgi:regulatory protein